MSFVPAFKLWNSAGDTLLYTFPVVVFTNAPQSTQKVVVIEGTRGVGCLTIDGGESSWDLIIRGVLSGDNYQAIVVAMDALEAAIVLNTAYKLRLDKTVSTYYSWNVKRITPITYPENLRTSHQVYECIFKANSW